MSDVPTSNDRREFLRKLVKAGYTAPVVSTVLLSACQPSPNPSGGMMLGGPSGPTPTPRELCPPDKPRCDPTRESPDIDKLLDPSMLDQEPGI